MGIVKTASKIDKNDMLYRVFDIIETKFGDRDLKNIVGHSKSTSGLKKIYKDYKHNEHKTAKRELTRLYNQLDKILVPVNEKACSKCNNSSACGSFSDCGCCHGCFETTGHFSGSQNCAGDKERVQFRKEIGKLKDEYGWDHVYGFWSKKGCVLPRRKRSITCISYSCSRLVNRFKDKGKEFHSITDKISKYTSVIDPVLR